MASVPKFSKNVSQGTPPQNQTSTRPSPLGSGRSHRAGSRRGTSPGGSAVPRGTEWPPAAQTSGSSPQLPPRSRVKGGEFSRTAAPGGDSRPISLGGGLEMCATFDVFGWRISFCISLLVGGWTLLARGSGFGVGTAHGPWSLSGPAIKHLQRNLPGSAGARGRLKARPSWAGCQSSHSVGDDWEL